MKILSLFCYLSIFNNLNPINRLLQFIFKEFSIYNHRIVYFNKSFKNKICGRRFFESEIEFLAPVFILASIFV